MATVVYPPLLFHFFVVTPGVIPAADVSGVQTLLAMAFFLSFGKFGFRFIWTVGGVK